ncbi:MAG: type IV toxin-antitoxin system AbiEi family antitoxin domain-containing protein [Lapillicoccus sp.]
MNGWGAIADGQGLLRARDAARLGLTSRDLAHLVASGDLVRLERGWYSLPLPVLEPDVDTVWERRRRLHAAKARAMVRAHDGRAVASHYSALVLTGLPAFAADLRQVHLTRVIGTQSRRRAGLTIHRAAPGAIWSDGAIALPSLSLARRPPTARWPA